MIAQTTRYVDVPQLRQCTNCWSFDHPTTKCKATKPVCKYCAQDHKSEDHECKGCSEGDGPDDVACAHYPRKCVNCKAEHEADHRDCIARRRRKGEFIKTGGKAPVAGGRKTKPKAGTEASSKGVSVR
ncbi:hypothetical protein SISSUDRAFT_395886 [Sistotremastrum suecicum HHB10207 ss-3]|uniref:Uncharacterized protein n=1 Tax=Sistotremastrum suecicum HHB10207 ss-3 TaxID=1314776 RepID=A0A165YUD1_9AGAM|nr:hypothetical protein SISSUDRAFT_395886 [Sistotremastrum suecicum HHB10207 ss-3]